MWWCLERGFGMLGEVLFDFGEILSYVWRFWRDLINGLILENVVEKENKSKRDITKSSNWNSFNRMFTREILLIGCLCVYAQSWSIGYFNKDGICTKWAVSWYTCTNDTQWDTWYNRFLNKTTMLWEFWPYGQFYSSQVDKWSSWEGSWRDEWGYQSECYIWPTGMKFDLTLLKWVNNCTTSQLFIQD